jgi:N-acetylmuramoyl-L-alanine amidase
MRILQWNMKILFIAGSILYLLIMPISNCNAAVSEATFVHSPSSLAVTPADEMDSAKDKVRTHYLKLLLPTTAVIIDAGHGGIDSGAVHGTVEEKDINLEVGKKLYAILQSRGVPTILNRTHDYALSDDNRWHRTSSRHLKDLSQRMGLTREIKHVVFVSIHVNSVSNTKAHGPLVLHQPNGESSLLAQHIQEEMNRLYSTKKRPVAVKSFYVLKHVKSPAVLVELGFISNDNDLKRLTSNVEQKKMAASIADGILHYFWVN